MSQAGKPRKVGILFFLEKKKKVENRERKFCILTSTKEIDCYNQEVVFQDKKKTKKKQIYFSLSSFENKSIQKDYQQHKYLSISNLNKCEVKVDPDRTEVFQIDTSDGKTYLLAAQDEIDRRNWVQEILKTKEVPAIIALMNHEKLSNYAIRALINIANSTGKKKKKDFSSFHLVLFAIQN